jgi:hypothetical protein
MKRVILACIATVALVPLTAQGTAMASGGASQEVGQSAGSSQTAASAAGSAQIGASNENISVRIMSPGSDGAVTQINSSAAGSAAGNSNATSQSATQAGAAQQAIGQGAHNAQAALSGAASIQHRPSNENISVRIMSPGDAGEVKQVNASEAKSAAGNANHTGQTAQQAGAGAANQAIGQDAANAQLAKSLAASLQDHPSNVNAPVRIKSPGGGGAVLQVNDSGAGSVAGNTNHTDQSAGQAAGGLVPVRTSCEPSCGGGRPTVQAIGQDASSAQAAKSLGLSLQLAPANKNAGTGGSVVQVNDSTARSAAGNANHTTQNAEQSTGRGVPGACSWCGGHDGTVVQAIGQRAANEQAALSKALSLQLCPVNENAGSAGWPHEPERMAVPSVVQKNRSAGYSAAGNENGTRQAAGQTAGLWAVMAL